MRARTFEVLGEPRERALISWKAFFWRLSPQTVSNAATISSHLFLICTYFWKGCIILANTGRLRTVSPSPASATSYSFTYLVPHLHVVTAFILSTFYPPAGTFHFIFSGTVSVLHFSHQRVIKWEILLHKIIRFTSTLFGFLFIKVSRNTSVLCLVYK